MTRSQVTCFQASRSLGRLLPLDLKVDSPLQTVRGPAVFAAFVVAGNGGQVGAQGQGELTGRAEAGLGL